MFPSCLVYTGCVFEVEIVIVAYSFALFVPI